MRNEISIKFYIFVFFYLNSKIQLNRKGLAAETGGGCRWCASSAGGGKYSLTIVGSGTTIGGRYKDFGVEGFNVVVVLMVVFGVTVVGFLVGGRYSVLGGKYSVLGGRYTGFGTSGFLDVANRIGLLLRGGRYEVSGAG